MARKNWEMEAELEGLGLNGRPSGRRWGRLLFALVLVGVATFVLGFYVPLRRTHEALSGLHAQAVARAETAERSLARTTTELKEATAVRDGLKGELDQHRSAKASREGQVAELSKQITASLSSRIKQGVAVEADKESVLVSLPGAALFPAVASRPGSGVSVAGVRLLCDVAKAAGTRPLEVRLSAAPGGAAAAVLLGDEAAQGTEVVTALAKRCAVPEARLSVRVQAGSAAAGEAAAPVVLAVRAVD